MSINTTHFATNVFQICSKTEISIIKLSEDKSVVHRWNCSLLSWFYKSVLLHADVWIRRMWQAQKKLEFYDTKLSVSSRFFAFLFSVAWKYLFRTQGRKNLENHSCKNNIKNYGTDTLSPKKYSEFTIFCVFVVPQSFLFTHVSIYGCLSFIEFCLKSNPYRTYLIEEKKQ